jgi:hypothetical protein
MECLAAFLGSNNRVFICNSTMGLGTEAGISISAHGSPCLKTDAEAYFPLFQACVAYLKVSLQDCFSRKHKKILSSGIPAVGMKSSSLRISLEKRHPSAKKI